MYDIFTFQIIFFFFFLSIFAALILCLHPTLLHRTYIIRVYNCISSVLFYRGVNNNDVVKTLTLDTYFYLYRKPKNYRAQLIKRTFINYMGLRAINSSHFLLFKMNTVSLTAVQYLWLLNTFVFGFLQKKCTPSRKRMLMGFCAPISGVQK